MHRFFTTVCCIKFKKNVIGIISHSVFRIVVHLCFWLQNDLGTEGGGGGNDKDAYILYACKPLYHNTNNITKKKLRPMYKSVCTNFVTSFLAG